MFCKMIRKLNKDIIKKKKSKTQLVDWQYIEAFTWSLSAQV